MKERPVVSAAPGGVRIALKVIPRSPHTTLAGIRDGRVLVRVTAPPVESAANEAVVAAIAEWLGVAKRAVVIVSGQTARCKDVVVTGVTEADVRARLTGLD